MLKRRLLTPGPVAVPERVLLAMAQPLIHHRAPDFIPVFQEVRLAGAGFTPATWSAEVGLPDGTRVRLARGTDPGWMKALVECLRQPCSSH